MACGTPHLLMPYLGPGQPATELKYAVTIYSDVPISTPDAASGLGGDLWECECLPGGHGPTCPFRAVVEKMAKLEGLLDQRIAYFDELLCTPVPVPRAAASQFTSNPPFMSSSLASS